MPRATTSKLRYGVKLDDSGQWLSRPELVPSVGLTTTEPDKRRGWGAESSARQFLRRHPELKERGFKVRPID